MALIRIMNAFFVPVNLEAEITVTSGATEFPTPRTHQSVLRYPELAERAFAVFFEQGAEILRRL